MDFTRGRGGGVEEKQINDGKLGKRVESNVKKQTDNRGEFSNLQRELCTRQREVKHGQQK